MTESRLRRRTILSFVVFTALAGVAAGGWLFARSAPERMGIAGPFRAVLDWNGTLWHSLLSPNRSNSYPAPARGKKPRFNGDLGLRSPMDLAHWQVEVFSDRDRGAGRQRFDMAMFRALPKTGTSSLFFCIEGWSDPLSYAGVRFSDFLRAYGLGTRSGQPWNSDDPKRTEDLYRYVGLATPDREYYVSVDIESMLHSQTLLAYEENGEPLDLPNGAPLRLVIPIKYGIKSIKRIGAIFFSDERPPDYWAERGYDWFAGL